MASHRSLFHMGLLCLCVMNMIQFKLSSRSCSSLPLHHLSLHQLKLRRPGNFSSLNTTACTRVMDLQNLDPLSRHFHVLRDAVLQSGHHLRGRRGTHACDRHGRLDNFFDIYRFHNHSSVGLNDCLRHTRLNGRRRNESRGFEAHATAVRIHCAALIGATWQRSE